MLNVAIIDAEWQQIIFVLFSDLTKLSFFIVNV